MDDDDKVIEKYAQCNNCGIVHKITDICKSEIMHNHEELKSELSLNEIKLSLSESVVTILESSNADLPTFEAISFYLKHDKKGKFVVISKEEINGKIRGKLLRYEGNGRFAVEPF